MSELATLIHASAHHLPMIDDKSVQCVVTSPPYFGLRKYDGVQDVEWSEVTYSPMAGLPPITIAGCDSGCTHEWTSTISPAKSGGTKSKKVQTKGKDNFQIVPPIESGTCTKCGGWRGPLGNEPTIEAFIGHLILCAREWRRVLADDGVMWVNLGDSYNGSGKGGNPEGSKWKGFVGNEKREQSAQASKPELYGLGRKNLMMIPARFALAMQADGWILRSEIIWHKPNPMTESVTDRPTKAHEMVYLFSKRGKYFYDGDAVAEPTQESSRARMKRGVSDNHKNTNGAPGQSPHSFSRARPHDTERHAPTTRNLRTVWKIATQQFSGAHFACFPPALVEPMIKAGSRVGDTVLDPFSGSGTSGSVAIKLGRKYIGVDLAETYLDELSPQRLTVQMELA